MARPVFVYQGDVVPLTTADYERAFLVSKLGASALATDSIDDLRYKFYKGVVEGTLVLGGGGAIGGKPLAGNYIFTAASNGAFNDVFPVVAGTLYCVPLVLGAATPIDQFFGRVGTAGGAGSVIRYGIYNVGTDGLLSTLVIDAGTADSSTTGNKPIAVAKTIPAGAYWNVFVSSSSITQVRGLGSGPNYNMLSWMGANPDNNTPAGYITIPGYNANNPLPANAVNTGAAIAYGDIPVVYLRAA